MRFRKLVLVTLLWSFSILAWAEDINIRQTGATTDTTVVNTAQIQKAIDMVAAAGGGRVIIPPGQWVTGTVFLKSYVYLHLEPGATLLGSRNLKDYPLQEWRNESPGKLRHLVAAKKQHHTGITGQGIIDGRGPSFWEPIKTMPDWIVGKPDRITRWIEFTNCQDVLIRDVTLTSSPEWTLHLFECDRVTVDNIRIENHMFGPNNDGIDISGCRDVRVSNCYIRTCDDGICLKTLKENGICERITVTNCIIETSCAALKIGNETFNDIRQVTFSNCVVPKSSRAVAIYCEDGGNVEDIVVSNIVMDNNAPLILNRPIQISNWKKGTKAGLMRNIRLENIVCKTNGRVLLTAEEGCLIENLTIRGLTLQYMYLEDPYPLADSARSAQFAPKNKEARKLRAAIIAEGITNLQVQDVSVLWPDKAIPAEWRLPVKIENGFNYRTVRPDYTNPTPSTFHLLYTSRCTGSAQLPSRFGSTKSSPAHLKNGADAVQVRYP